ncbi:uncharacterized protein PV09_04842 [Verruconis gallopava]|uniref:PLD phosphodiesterase domain-containing protein n=1 Tax=Verruconis gallopava TaxID=253628 RepID=A0A0D1YTR5_9PEZI|nr:uncharacterized protein PV09_04842 [Verruconis gallopava]KIW04017.1 hypothetical protein PV09_04842 [Verruconis gallopava]
MAGEMHKDLGVVGSWWQAMMKNAAANKTSDPNYFATRPELLQTEANLELFVVGNGDDVYSHICPAIEQAQQEVILITCFWARSSSLDMLRESLRALSEQVMAKRRSKVRVFIGFSSLSALQKLFHTRSVAGSIYSGSAWTTKLSLPGPEELPGLDIQVKSVFVLPFSVMHPKFVIIDRKLVLLPSCNVSWESWFEGCIALSGPIVKQFVTFWQTFWARTSSNDGNPDDVSFDISDQTKAVVCTRRADTQPGAAYSIVALSHLPPCYAIFLPSPHHAWPRFSFPWQKHRPPPSTPLNTFVLELFESASSTIYIQTPNVTSLPVLSSILRMLRRGVDVHILTSEKLMILEQLVTAGTTTSRCIRKLIKLYKRSNSISVHSDEERLPVRIGKLKVEYYESKGCSQQDGEPVQTHLKLTIVDEEWTILGSGNLDRASWYTSQELGVAFKSRELAKNVHHLVTRQMEGRTKIAFDSAFS